MTAGTSCLGESWATSSSIWRLDFVRSPGQDPIAVLFRQVSRQYRDAAQVKTAIPEHRQERRVPPRGASHRDAQISRRLREVQHLGAVDEQGRASLASIEPALVHFTDMRDRIGFDPTRLLQDLRETLEQLVIGEGLELVYERHASCNITRTFFPA
jgi:hypothetical protein